MIRVGGLPLVLAACVGVDRDPGDRFRGTSDAVAWEVVGITTAVATDEREIRWTYTLILRETAGRMVGFEGLETSVQNRGGLPEELFPGVTEEPFRHRLEPRGELRVNGSYGLRFTVGSRSGFGEVPGGRAGVVVRYRFLGRDGEGRPVAVVMHVPLDPGVGRRTPPGPPASPPPAPSARLPATPALPEPPASAEPAPAHPPGITTSGPATDHLKALGRAAADCQVRFPGVETVAIDPRGVLSFRYRSLDDDRGFRACYETRTREVMSGRLAMTPGASAGSSLDLESRGDSLLVTVTLAGAQPARLLVDTGAEKTVVRPAVLHAIGVVPAPALPGFDLVTATGERVGLPLARVDSLSMGPFSILDLHVGVYEVLPDSPGVDGLLGQDVLGHFRVHIDRSAGRLTLEPRP